MNRKPEKKHENKTGGGILAPARLARTAGMTMTLLVISLFLFGTSLLDLLELKTYDMRLRALPSAPSRQVAIAAIDERSLAALGRWPWSRATLARLVDRLDQLGARVIAFDLIFPEAESPQADAELARAFSGRKVVLGTVFLLHREEAADLGDDKLEAARRAMAGQAIADVRKSGGADAEIALQEPHGVLVNIPELQTSAAYAGHINVVPDQDGVIRLAPLVFRQGGRYFPSFGVQAARAFLGVKDLALYTADYGITGIGVGSRYIPVDEGGRMLVRYRGPARTFDTVSIADIFDGRADPALLRERVVLIGGTAQGIGDIRVTPYGAAFPGVEIHASIIQSLIEGDVLQRPGWMTPVDIALIAALGIALTLLLPRLGVTGGALLALSAGAAYLFLANYLFQTEGLWLNVVYPTILAALLFVTTTLAHYSTALAQYSAALAKYSTAVAQYFSSESKRRYLKAAFQRYVPEDVINRIVKDSDSLKLGGERRELTVLFCDIRGFTALSETLAPEKLVRLLNLYFTAMTNQVFRHEGSLDKYIGDAVMAVFGAPLRNARNAPLACRTALDMIKALPELKADLRRQGLPVFDIGIGINTGPMIFGNMGSATRFNFTVTGDAVNVATRIESLNKAYGTSILLSERTWAQVKDEFHAHCREIDRVQVRGRRKDVVLYELIPEGRYASLDWLGEFGDAYRLLRDGNFARAAERFDALHAQVGDPVSAYHARACRTPHRRESDES
jgi:adenylate cyclase